MKLRLCFLKYKSRPSPITVPDTAKTTAIVCSGISPANAVSDVVGVGIGVGLGIWKSGLTNSVTGLTKGCKSTTFPPISFS